MIRVMDVTGGKIDPNKCLKVSENVYNQFIKKYKPRYNDIVISRVGSFGNIGLITNNNMCLGQNVSLIHAENINPLFLFYYLNSKIVKNFINNNVFGASQKSLSLQKIKEIPIRLYSDKEQERIVKILVNFDKLKNDLVDGLPAEIEERQKQYEYYRDKLLTFKELSE